MATTSPDNIRTPNAGDQYALVQDLGVMADSIQSALTKRANTFQGTAAQRAAFTSTATNGMLWQDSDGMKMIWRKDGTAWAPAVWRWSGTTTQMNSFAAPDGFKWYSTTDNSEYVRKGGAWVGAGWTLFTPASPWSRDLSFPPAYRVSGGRVEFRGRVNGSLATDSTIYTLPNAAFAPTELSFFLADRGSPTAISRLTVNTSGALVHSASTGALAAASIALTQVGYSI